MTALRAVGEAFIFIGCLAEIVVVILILATVTGAL